MGDWSKVKRPTCNDPSIRWDDAAHDAITDLYEQFRELQIQTRANHEDALEDFRSLSERIINLCERVNKTNERIDGNNERARRHEDQIIRANKRLDKLEDPKTALIDYFLCPKCLDQSEESDSHDAGEKGSRAHPLHAGGSTARSRSGSPSGSSECSRATGVSEDDLAVETRFEDFSDLLASPLRAYSERELLEARRDELQECSDWWWKNSYPRGGDGSAFSSHISQRKAGLDKQIAALSEGTNSEGAGVAQEGTERRQSKSEVRGSTPRPGSDAGAVASAPVPSESADNSKRTPRNSKDLDDLKLFRYVSRGDEESNVCVDGRNPAYMVRRQWELDTLQARHDSNLQQAYKRGQREAGKRLREALQWQTDTDTHYMKDHLYQRLLRELGVER